MGWKSKFVREAILFGNPSTPVDGLQTVRK